ncbi:hypothetical protein DPMN_150279 [Dreissena polymorpha]|uniref:Uncharacterized protein n=1 Tax=Dreissena polymorpha TaxID=45954 RepID=A0A9D4FHQ0_DREPO|nr:hypothetical protein DPMN_150279 [Dreissena polymorpha]
MHSVVDQDANRGRRAATESEEWRWPLEIPYLIVKDEKDEKDEKFGIIVLDDIDCLI